MERWSQHEGATGEEGAAVKLLAQVEPIAPAPGARSRVWARLARSQAEPRPLPILRIALTGALAGALAVGLWTRLDAPKGASVAPAAAVAALSLSAASGAVHVAGAEGDGPVRPGLLLSAGRTLSTEADGSASLSGPALGTIKLQAQSTLRVDEDRGLRLALLAGSLERNIGGDQVQLLELVAGAYVIESEGSFRAVRLEGDRIQLHVYSGRAHVRGGDRNVEVEAGGRFESPPAPTAALEPSSEAQSESEPDRAPARARARERERPRERARDNEPTLAPLPGVEPTTAAPAPAAEADDAIQALYRRAQAEPDPDQALALFDQVAASNNPYAEVAGHQAARIAMQKGRLSDAVSRFERLRGRFPLGAYAPEGALNLIECRLGLGDLASASRELDLFLSARPDSERSPELRFLRGELLRRRGQCAKALTDYRAAQGSRRDADATYFEAWCRLELQDQAGGEALLARYLSRYPEGRYAADAKKVLAPRK